MVPELDHVLAVTRSGGGRSYVAAAASVVADDDADVSDHLMVKAVLRRE